MGAAAGTSCGTVASLLGVGTLVFRRFGAFIPVASAVRALIGAAAGFGVAWLVTGDGSIVRTMLGLVAGCGAYGLTLIVTRELRREDLAILRTIVKR